MADEKEQVCRDDVRREERAAGDDQDASGCTDVVVVVKTRKKSKKDKVGRKTEGKKHEKPAAPSRSPEPEEQGRLAECLCVPRPRPLKVRGYVRICTCRSHAVSLPLALCVVLLSRVSTLSFVSSLSSVSLPLLPHSLSLTVIFVCARVCVCVAVACTSGPPSSSPSPSFPLRSFIPKLLVMSRSAGQRQKTRFPLVFAFTIVSSAAKHVVLRRFSPPPFSSLALIIR